ncbi:MAG: hypothetical protein ACRDP8_04955 [Actinopolymorphaceae bacterium]
MAYSPGQAQGALVLRALEKAGLTKTDVRPIKLPSTGDVYPNALANHEVDVAPIGGVNIKRCLRHGPPAPARVIPPLRPPGFAAVHTPQDSWTGRRSRPRIRLLCRHRRSVGVPASRRWGKRSSRQVNAISPSSRASGAPRQ